MYSLPAFNVNEVTVKPQKQEKTFSKKKISNWPMEASFLWRNFYAPPNALLYLSTFEATKKWTMPVQNWGKVYGELAIMYDGRLPK